jgi:hypothetical protein
MKNHNFIFSFQQFQTIDGKKIFFRTFNYFHLKNFYFNYRLWPKKAENTIYVEGKNCTKITRIN